MHRSSPQAAILLVTSALFCSLPGLLPAEEALSTTAQHLDKTAGQEDAATAAAEIGARFTAFAGSSGNATALVTGLRNGSTITLTSTVNGTATTTSFQPATGKLGYGNAFISLALAQESLVKAGITQPTPAQIEAALNGGSVTGSNGTAVSLAGVLTLRAGGKGWGDIAQTLGVKLGRVVSELHAANERAENPDKPDFAGKSAQVSGKQDNTERPERAGRPDWAGAQGVGHNAMTPPVHPGRH